MKSIIENTSFLSKGFWGMGFWGFGQPLPPTNCDSHQGHLKLAILGCMVSSLTIWFLLVVACSMIIFICTSHLIIINFV